MNYNDMDRFCTRDIFQTAVKRIKCWCSYFTHYVINKHEDNILTTIMKYGKIFNYTYILHFVMIDIME